MRMGVKPGSVRCGFQEILGFNSRKEAMFRQPSATFILRLVAIGRGIVSLMRITAFCIITGFKVSSSGYTRHYTEFCIGVTVQKG